MFKNLIVYRIAEQWAAALSEVEEALQKTPFIRCGPTQKQTDGWVPPRGEDHGLLVESVGGQWIMRFMTEAKQLPASVLNRRVQEKADAIEKEFGRKPGKKEKRDLKDEAEQDLLPMAFTKMAATWVWIDPTARFLVIDASAQSKADVIVSLLVESLQGFGVSLLDTQTSAQAAMAHWLLTHEAPPGFSVDRECELKAADESKAVVRYGRHPLDTEEVKAHVQAGKLPTKLALTWDDRVSFVLTEALQVKKLALLDAVLDQAGDEGGFDTDVAIATGELSKLIPDLIEALGGEGRGKQQQASEGADAPAPTPTRRAYVTTSKTAGLPDGNAGESPREGGGAGPGGQPPGDGGGGDSSVPWE